MPTNIGQLFLFGEDILSTQIDAVTNLITAQIGDVQVSQAASSQNEWWQHVGFASRPAIPVAGQSAAQCLAIRQTDRDVIFASRDSRGASIVGNLGDGETCIYSSAGQGKVLFKANGVVAFQTTDDNTATGNAIGLKISPTEGLVFVSPWGDLSFGPNGLRIRHSSGFEIRGVGLSGLSLGPISIGSVIKIKGATVVLDASSVLVGPAAGALNYSPVELSALVPPVPGGDPGGIPLAGIGAGTVACMAVSSNVLRVTG